MGYNHPPFSGVLLLAMNWVVEPGGPTFPSSSEVCPPSQTL